MNSIYEIMEQISVSSNVTYKYIDSTELKLDVYFPAKKLGEEPWEKIPEEYKPTLIYFHGGGWTEGDRISRFLGLFPYLEKGWCVVNVDYRLLPGTNLIGSLNDCIDAINWVKKNSAKYKFDSNRIYLSGESAGGHLALLAGMINDAEIDKTKINKRSVNVKGIINWYGVTHLEEAIKHWNDSIYTKLVTGNWIGNIGDYYHTSSPINHISGNTPPIISIHGDADINVEVGQAIHFHRKLDAKNINNELVIIKGKKHGNFSSVELKSIFSDIWKFFNISN